MHDVWWDAIHIAGAQDRLFIAVGEAELAREHRAYVLLFVNVLVQL
jgi:hypothetical protein